jgi:methylmalonyl-CoA carboxyltransferase small subunit
MSKEILAPMPGTIIEILVSEGEEVLEYQEVLILEAMKMENAIPSPEAGTVKEIKVNVNDKVSTDQVLMILE